METIADPHDEAVPEGDGDDVLATAGEETRRLSLAFQTWHRLLRLLLLIHVPALALFAYFREVPTI